MRLMVRPRHFKDTGRIISDLCSLSCGGRDSPQQKALCSVLFFFNGTLDDSGPPYKLYVTVTVVSSVVTPSSGSLFGKKARLSNFVSCVP